MERSQEQENKILGYTAKKARGSILEGSVYSPLKRQLFTNNENELPAAEEFSSWVLRDSNCHDYLCKYAIAVRQC